MALIHKSKFSNARIQLSIWYTFILFLVIFSFSAGIYSLQINNMKNLMLHQFINLHASGFVTPDEVTSFNNQIEILRNQIFINILSLDLLILFVSTLLSYFLAGRTLKPIDETIKIQKEFIADVSHELRTPIAAIQTACEITLRSKTKTEEDYRKVIEQTYEEIKRLHKMTEDLLTLSKTDYIHDTRALAECSLDSVLKSVIDSMESLAQDKGVSIEVKQLELVTLKANRDKMKQLFVILIDNAIKYNKENGKIIISLTAKPSAKFVITDTGIGIQAEAIHRIFERHYQAEGQHEKTSLGLGLTIAKKIIDLHNAKITVASKEGVGSRFTVIFS